MDCDHGPFLLEIAQRHSRLRVDEGLLRQAVDAVLSAEGVRSAEISLALTDDAEIHRINRDFLGHDYPTDVISFSLSTDDSGETGDRHGKVSLQGELIISLDTAERVAAEQGWSLAAEVVLYTVHGLLHLCGYDDQTELTRPMMRKREREILSMFTLPDGARPAAAGWEDGSS